MSSMLYTTINMDMSTGMKTLEKKKYFAEFLEQGANW